MNIKLALLLCFSLSLAFSSFAIKTEKKGAAISLRQAPYGDDLNDIERYFLLNLNQFSTTDDYRRSIIRIGLDGNGGVRIVSTMNHAYSSGQEEALLQLVRKMEWSLPGGKQQFYLILEIENGAVKASLR